MKSRQNAAMVEEATAVTDALNGRQAQRLVPMLTRFRTTAQC